MVEITHLPKFSRFLKLWKYSEAEYFCSCENFLKVYFYLSVNLEK